MLCRATRLVRPLYIEICRCRRSSSVLVGGHTNGRSASIAKLTIRSILEDVLADKGILSETQVRCYLQKKGYAYDDLKLWLKLLRQSSSSSSSIEASLSLLRTSPPPYVLLSLFKHASSSNSSFTYLHNLFRNVRGSLDDSSHQRAFSQLVRSAAKLDTSLLHRLQDDLPLLPSSTTGHWLNQLIRALKLDEGSRCFELSLHQEMSRRHIYVPSQRSGTDTSISRNGSVCSTTQERTSAVLQATSIAEHLQAADTMDDLLHRITTSGQDLTDSAFWADLQTFDKFRKDATFMCMQLVDEKRLSLTPHLVGMILKHNSYNKRLVETVCRTAVRESTMFSIFVWEGYLNALLDQEQYGVVVHVITCEPGGTHLIDMEPGIRRRTRIWTQVLRKLNIARSAHRIGKLTFNLYLGQIYDAARKFEITFDDSLFRAFAKAATLSGSNMWQATHACDAISQLHRDNIESLLADIPKDRIEATFFAYMQVLVLNEESVQLMDAMQLLLQHQINPSSKLIKLFAIGIWEHGDVTMLQQWQAYFEDELKLMWPDAQETFAYKSKLVTELPHFYDT